jgi:zinc/manganese transport system permease protein
MCSSAPSWRSNDQALWLIGGIASVTFVTLALLWRGLVAECMDPVFLRSVSRAGPYVHFLFLMLVVLNLVGGFEALGTLLAVGLMILPAAAARFWTPRLETMCVLAVAIGIVANLIGLLVSYHLSVASGPAIILTAGVIYTLSLLFGSRGVVAARIVSRHRTA